MIPSVSEKRVRHIQNLQSARPASGPFVAPTRPPLAMPSCASATATSSAHSPTQVAKVAPYLAINPGLFDSADHWSYRDLQKLAKRLDLPSTGKRDEVVERLRFWHREQRTTGQAGQFHAVQVRATPEGKAISPRLLSPLVSSARRGPLKSGILSSSKRSAREKRTSFSGSESDRSVAESPARPLGQRGGVLFSPVSPLFFSLPCFIPRRP
jgi:hypothetical protein